jgi:hypothetical protein
MYVNILRSSLWNISSVFKNQKDVGFEESQWGQVELICIHVLWRHCESDWRRRKRKIEKETKEEKETKQMEKRNKRNK